MKRFVDSAHPFAPRQYHFCSAAFSQFRLKYAAHEAGVVTEGCCPRGQFQCGGCLTRFSVAVFWVQWALRGFFSLRSFLVAFVGSLMLLLTVSSSPNFTLKRDAAKARRPLASRWAGVGKVKSIEPPILH